jgi:hypothetical protein
VSNILEKIIVKRDDSIRSSSEYPNYLLLGHKQHKELMTALNQVARYGSAITCVKVNEFMDMELLVVDRDDFLKVTK